MEKLSIVKYRDYQAIQDDPIINAAAQVGVGWIARSDSNLTITLTDLSSGWWAVDVTGWVHYSRRYGHSYTERRALVCWDADNNLWAGFRVPVGYGPDYLKPTEVIRAEKEGRFVGRQGDVWILKAKGNRSTIKGDLGRHKIEEKTLRHPQHAPINLPDKYRLIVGVVTSTRGKVVD